MNSNSPNFRLLFVAGRELSYSRNAVLLRALRRNGWEVDTIGFHTSVSSILATSLQLSLLIMKKLLLQKYQLIVAGFYSYLLLPLIKVMTKTPLLFDAFISNYDTLCYDRQVIHPSSVLGRGIYWFDYWSCRLAAHLLLDTPYHAQYFVDTFRLDPKRVSWLPVGCNEDIFQPSQPALNRKDSVVLYYSTFLPLHGVDVILDAADRLRAYPIRFRLIGEGLLRRSMQARAQQLRLENLEFVPPVSLSDLAKEITNADICLGGHFGKSEKSQRVVPGKIYQMMASRRAIIAANSPANRSLIGNTESILLVPPNHSDALAQAILTLHENPQFRFHLAESALNRYLECCSEQVIATRLRDVIAKFIH